MTHDISYFAILGRFLSAIPILQQWRYLNSMKAGCTSETLSETVDDCLVTKLENFKFVKNKDLDKHVNLVTTHSPSYAF